MTDSNHRFEGMQSLLAMRFFAISRQANRKGTSGAKPFQKQLSLDNKKTEAIIVRQISRRMPFVYAIAIIMIILVAVSFYGTASNIHLAITAAPLIIVGISRAIYWSPILVDKRSPSRISRDLKLLPITGTGVVVGLMIFGLSLYPLGNSQQQHHVHLLSMIACFVGILGLNHSPKTARNMTIVSVVPSTIMFLYFGHEDAILMCLAMVSVAILLLVIGARQNEGLLELIDSKATLERAESNTAKLNTQLHRQAYVDDLTGIPNRRAFFEKFDEQRSKRSYSDPWLALVDLDEFKAINDLFGHRAGDAVLKEVAKRIAENVGSDSCARLGGDEFAFFLPGTLSESAALGRANELAEIIALPIENESQALTIKASLGLRLTVELSVNECIERADWALYRAKENPGSAVVFSKKNEIAMEERAHIAHLFDHADFFDELAVVYQPIFNFDTSEIESVEVLARWITKEGILVMPDVFIPMAEHTVRISELTKVIISKALSDLPSAFSGLSIHVNLSAKDLLNSDLLEWLLDTEIFEEVGRPRIVLELTETAILAGGIKAAENLRRLRAAGFRIALDDFGVGQSSLSRIHTLPLDQIKIDKSFCCDTNENEHGWQIIATILALSRQLGLECIVEGIETESQALKARSLGLRLMQGYYFSKPLSSDHFDTCISPAFAPNERLSG